MTPVSATTSTTPTADNANHLIEQATHAADQASALAHRGMDSVRDISHQLRLKAEHASDSTVKYIKEEPVKAVLIAAATGATLMALVTLVARSRSHG